MSRRQPRVVIAGRVLDEAQRAGRACIYCRVTFGAMDPVPTVPGLDVLWLAAHRSCVDNSKVGSERRALVRRSR
jgi:hypothetical protein